DDGGATWSKPKPIAGSVPANGGRRCWPVVTVSPGDASVNVVYYESLEQAVPGAPACNIAIGGGLRRVGPAHSLVNTMLVRSKDGGRTFGDPVTVSSVTSDWCAGTTNIRPNFGDYIGATTVGTTTFAVWADSRETSLIGGTPRNVVDIFFAPVGEGQYRKLESIWGQMLDRAKGEGLPSRRSRGMPEEPFRTSASISLRRMGLPSSWASRRSNWGWSPSAK